MPHPDKPVEYPDNKFTKEQLVMLKTEPMLKVEVITDKVDAIDSLTVPQIKEKLDKLKIEYKPDAKKAELVALLKQSKDGDPE